MSDISHSFSLNTTTNCNERQLFMNKQDWMRANDISIADFQYFMRNDWGMTENEQETIINDC